MKFRLAGKFITYAIMIGLLACGTVWAGLKEDINGDGRIGVLDVLALLVRGRANPGDSGVDYNGDGVFTSGDAVALLRNISRPEAGPGGAHQTLPEGVIAVDSAGAFVHNPAPPTCSPGT